MQNFRLKEFVEQNIQNFNPKDPQDLIKAEKLLKAQQKIDSEFSLNDIENFIEFYKDNGNKYEAILQDENLQKILKNEDFKIDSSQNNISSHSSSLHEDFGNDYEENILNYIQLNIKNNNWKNLRIFYKNYFPIISYENKDLLIDSITTKNNLVRGTIPYTDQYHLLLNQYKHSVDRDFYGLQSDIDSAYFNEEILDINNDLANHQHTTQQNKVFLGKIFVALASFDAYTEELKGLLIKNSRIGGKWVNPTSEIITVEKNSNRKYIEKDYGKYEEVILLIIYLSLLGLISFYLYIKLDDLFWGFVGLEFILFLILNKRLNSHYMQGPSSNGKLSTRRKIKKWMVKFLILQIYVAVIAVVFAAIGLAIAISVGTGGLGVGVFVVIFWIIRAVVKRK